MVAIKRMDDAMVTTFDQILVDVSLILALIQDYSAIPENCVISLADEIKVR